MNKLDRDALGDATVNRIYLAGEVADLARVTVKDVQNWAGRGVLVGHKGGGAKGRRRLFSWSNVMQVAVARGFIEVGVNDLPVAFRAAEDFAYVGADASPQSPARSPGLPFHHKHGTTFVLRTAGASAEVAVPLDGKMNLWTALPMGLSRLVSFTAVNVSEIFARVCNDLGHDYRIVLDAAYPEDAT